jgi:hypothetical protein
MLQLRVAGCRFLDPPPPQMWKRGNVETGRCADLPIRLEVSVWSVSSEKIGNLHVAPLNLSAAAANASEHR